jgi:hypothetical protein
MTGASTRGGGGGGGGGFFGSLLTSLKTPRNPPLEDGSECANLIPPIPLEVKTAQKTRMRAEVMKRDACIDEDPPRVSIDRDECTPLAIFYGA